MNMYNLSMYNMNFNIVFLYFYNNFFHVITDDSCYIKDVKLDSDA